MTDYYYIISQSVTVNGSILCVFFIAQNIAGSYKTNTIYKLLEYAYVNCDRRTHLTLLYGGWTQWNVIVIEKNLVHISCAEYWIYIFTVYLAKLICQFVFVL